MTQARPDLSDLVVDDGEQEVHTRLVVGRTEPLAMTDQRICELRDLLARFPGPCFVMGHVCFPPSGRETLIQCGPQYRVEPTGLLFGGLERLLGPDSWRLLPAGTRGRWETLP
jgi:hypothetical protein